jgi:hypothetical protein
MEQKTGQLNWTGSGTGRFNRTGPRRVKPISRNITLPLSCSMLFTSFFPKMIKPNSLSLSNMNSDSQEPWKQCRFNKDESWKELISLLCTRIHIRTMKITQIRSREEESALPQSDATIRRFCFEIEENSTDSCFWRKQDTLLFRFGIVSVLIPFLFDLELDSGFLALWISLVRIRLVVHVLAAVGNSISDLLLFTLPIFFFCNFDLYYWCWIRFEWWWWVRFRPESVSVVCSFLD